MTLLQFNHIPLTLIFSIHRFDPFQFDRVPFKGRITLFDNISKALILFLKKRMETQNKKEVKQVDLQNGLRLIS